MFGSLAYKLRGPLHISCYLSEYRYFSEGVVEGGRGWSGYILSLQTFRFFRHLCDTKLLALSVFMLHMESLKFAYFEIFPSLGRLHSVREKCVFFIEAKCELHPLSLFKNSGIRPCTVTSELSV